MANTLTLKRVKGLSDGVAKAKGLKDNAQFQKDLLVLSRPQLCEKYQLSLNTVKIWRKRAREKREANTKHWLNRSRALRY